MNPSMIRFLSIAILSGLGLALLPTASALDPAQEKELKRVQQKRLDATNLQGVAREQALLQARAELEKLIKENAWAKYSIEVRMERVQFLEDLEAFGGAVGAIRGWDELMKQNPRNTPKLLEQYHDGYYHLVYCLYKNATKMAPGAQQAASIKQAAFLIVKLETAMPDMGADFLKKRYKELLEKEPILKNWYVKEGGKALVEDK
jgi:hypothetical protein